MYVLCILLNTNIAFESGHNNYLKEQKRGKLFTHLCSSLSFFVFKLKLSQINNLLFFQMNESNLASRFISIIFITLLSYIFNGNL